MLRDHSGAHLPVVTGRRSAGRAIARRRGSGTIGSGPDRGRTGRPGGNGMTGHPRGCVTTDSATTGNGPDRRGTGRPGGSGMTGHPRGRVTTDSTTTGSGMSGSGRAGATIGSGTARGVSTTGGLRGSAMVGRRRGSAVGGLTGRGPGATEARRVLPGRAGMIGRPGSPRVVERTTGREVAARAPTGMIGRAAVETAGSASIEAAPPAGPAGTLGTGGRPRAGGHSTVIDRTASGPGTPAGPGATANNPTGRAGARGAAAPRGRDPARVGPVATVPGNRALGNRAPGNRAGATGRTIRLPGRDRAGAMVRIGRCPRSIGAPTNGASAGTARRTEPFPGRHDRRIVRRTVRLTAPGVRRPGWARPGWDRTSAAPSATPASGGRPSRATTPRSRPAAVRARPTAPPMRHREPRAGRTAIADRRRGAMPARGGAPEVRARVRHAPPGSPRRGAAAEPVAAIRSSTAGDRRRGRPIGIPRPGPDGANPSARVSGPRTSTRPGRRSRIGSTGGNWAATCCAICAA
jgi:hypothetical protein